MQQAPRASKVALTGQHVPLLATVAEGQHAKSPSTAAALQVGGTCAQAGQPVSAYERLLAWVHRYEKGPWNVFASVLCAVEQRSTCWCHGYHGAKSDVPIRRVASGMPVSCLTCTRCLPWGWAAIDEKLLQDSVHDMSEQTLPLDSLRPFGCKANCILLSILFILFPVCMIAAGPLSAVSVHFRHLTVEACEAMIIASFHLPHSEDWKKCQK